MGKYRNTNDLKGRRTAGPLLAVSLAASLAVGASASALAAPRILHHTADEAAAIMSDRQPLRAGRYLGVVNPGPSSRGYQSDYASQRMNARPGYVTVNSSITSPGTPLVGVDVATTGTGAVSGTTAAATVAGTSAASSVVTPLTPTEAAMSATAGSFAAVRPTATDAIANNLGVTAASNGAARTSVVSSGTTARTITTAAASSTTAASAATPTVTAASNAAATPATSVSGGVRILRPSSGAVTITNSTSTTSSSASGSSSRSQ